MEDIPQRGLLDEMMIFRTFTPPSVDLRFSRTIPSTFLNDSFVPLETATIGYASCSMLPAV